MRPSRSCSVRQAAGIVAVIYDGFIAPTQPTEVLESAVREASEIHLGYALDVRLKAQALWAPLDHNMLPCSTLHPIQCNRDGGI